MVRQEYNTVTILAGTLVRGTFTCAEGIISKQIGLPRSVETGRSVFKLT